MKYKLTGFARFIIFMGVLGTIIYLSLPHLSQNKKTNFNVAFSLQEDVADLATKIASKVKTRIEEKNNKRYNRAELESLRDEVDLLRKELANCKGEVSMEGEHTEY
jgi:hypothetical protein